MLQRNAQTAPNSSDATETLRRDRPLALIRNDVDRLAGLCDRALHRRAQAVGVEGAGQQAVDGDASRRQLAAREAGDEARQAAARSVREAEDVDRRLHRARGDVDDAAVSALGHAVDGRLHQLDRRQHVGVDRLHPDVAVPVAEIARRRAAGVVDEDVDLRAGGERGGAAGFGGDVAGDGANLAAAERAQLACRRFQGVGAARGDHDVDALFRERHRAALAEPLARGADKRPFAFDPEFHRVISTWPATRFR